jgi:hypothetical protein
LTTSDRDGAERDRLARELREAFAGRALLYDAIDRELTAEIGADRAAEVLGRAIERRGREVAAAMFADIDRTDPRAVADRFLATSPDGGTIYPTMVDRADGAVTIAVQRCPLQDAWRAAGASPERVARLCRIAGRFDTGLFGATGVTFSAETWTPGRAGCCRICLSR